MQACHSMCRAGHNRSAATSPGGVERRGDPTKVCREAALACSGAESAASGHTCDWLAHARRSANSGDIVTISAEALHVGTSTHHDWRLERFSAPIDFAAYFAQKAAWEGISVARKSA